MNLPWLQVWGTSYRQIEAKLQLLNIMQNYTLSAFAEKIRLSYTPCSLVSSSMNSLDSLPMFRALTLVSRSTSQAGTIRGAILESGALSSSDAMSSYNNLFAPFNSNHSPILSQVNEINSASGVQTPIISEISQNSQQTSHDTYLDNITNEKKNVNYLVFIAM